jgi:predicted nucleic acid-binding Zn finger protein
VWTNLDDLAEAWALEARRVLRHDGRFYFTINDRSAVTVFRVAARIANAIWSVFDRTTGRTGLLC